MFFAAKSHAPSMCTSMFFFSDSDRISFIFGCIPPVAGKGNDKINGTFFAKLPISLICPS